MDGAAVRHPQPKRKLHLGLPPGDAYARWFNPDMAPLSPHGREALSVGPVASERLLALEAAPSLEESGYHDLENGFGFTPDGALHVAVRTELPGVTPEMIDWWFGWHSEHPSRYKLWHPRAHVHACWHRPEGNALRGAARYLGRVSFVDEYLGSRLHHLAIGFVPPARFGLPDATPDVTYICAECGLTDTPVQGGILIHQVRRMTGGSEMRSRFWVAGRHARLEASGPWNSLLRRAARLVGPGVDDGRALLVHCAQEMAHLGTFLPEVFRELGES